MRRLLLDEKPLFVLPSLAQEVGLNEAIVLQQIHYWIETSGHEIDGEVWMYATYEELQNQFPWWSAKTIQRTLTNLKDKNLIKIGNFNKKRYDKTNWYTINYDVLQQLENGVDVQMDRSNCPVDEDNLTSCRSGQNDQTNTIDQTTTNINIYPIGHKDEDYPLEFKEFWKHYPRHIDKRSAFRWWKARIKEKVTAAALIMAAKNYAAHCRANKIEMQYMKYPSTFLGRDKPYEEYVNGPPEPPGGESLTPESATLEAYRKATEEWS